MQFVFLMSNSRPSLLINTAMLRPKPRGPVLKPGPVGNAYRTGFIQRIHLCPLGWTFDGGIKEVILHESVLRLALRVHVRDVGRVFYCSGKDLSATQLQLYRLGAARNRYCWVGNFVLFSGQLICSKVHCKGTGKLRMLCGCWQGTTM